MTNENEVQEEVKVPLTKDELVRHLSGLVNDDKDLNEYVDNYMSKNYPLLTAKDTNEELPELFFDIRYGVLIAVLTEVLVVQRSLEPKED